MTPRRWVCDGCMRWVVLTEVAVWADMVHVLCRRCADRAASEALSERSNRLGRASR